MARADGTIIIDTEIKEDGVRAGIEDIKKSLARMTKKLDGIKNAFDEAFSGDFAKESVSDQKKIQSEIDQTKESIDSLADSDKELSAQMQRDTSSEKFSDLKEEVNQAEDKMDSLGDSAKSAAGEFDDAVDSMSESADNLGKVLGDLGDGLDDLNTSTKLGNLMQASETLSEVGGKVIEFGKSTMEMSSDVQSAVTKVNGYFGLTGDAAEQMGTVVENVFKTGVTDSLDEVANAVISVNNNLKNLDPTTLETITTQAINMEQVFGSDMNETMRGVNALMVNFGLDAQTAMDYLVTGTQNGLDKTQELGDNLSEYSGKFAEAGYSADEYFQLLNNGLEGGFYNLDKVNDAINEVTTRLADGTIEESIGSYSEKTQELFEAWKNGGATQKDVIESIVSDISSTTNQQEAMNMAALAFGTMAEDGGLRAITSLTSVGDAYDDISGKAAALGESTTTPMQEMQAAVNEMKIALAPLGTQLAQLAAEVLPVVVDAIISLIEGFISLPGPVKTFIGVLAGVLALLSTLAPIITTIMTVITTIGSAALLPIIGIIAGVVAAVTAAIAIFQNWGAITEWFSGVWTAVCTTVQNIWQIVSTAVISAVQTFVTWIQQAWTSLISTISSVMQNIQTTIINVWNAILSNPVVQTIVDTVHILFQTLSSTLQGIWEGIKSIAESAWELIKNVILAPVLLLIDLVTGDFDALKSDIQNIWENIKNAAQSIWESIKSIISSVVDGIKATVTTVWQSIKSTIKSILDAIRGTVENIWNSIRNFITNAVNGIKTGAVNGFNSMKNGISNAIRAIPGIIQNMFNRVSNIIGNLISNAFSWGSDFINGLKNGIMSGVNAIVDAVKNVANSIRSFLHFSVPDVGPLADADEYGPDFMDLLATGITKNIKSVRKAAEGAAYAMNAPLSTAKLPNLSRGTTVPEMSTVTNYNNTINNTGSDVGQLIALMNQFLSSNQDSNKNQRITIKVNRKTLFDMMIDEAKLRQGQTGQNVFEL